MGIFDRLKRRKANEEAEARRLVEELEALRSGSIAKALPPGKLRGTAKDEIEHVIDDYTRGRITEPEARNSVYNLYRSKYISEKEGTVALERISGVNPLTSKSWLGRGTSESIKASSKVAAPVGGVATGSAKFVKESTRGVWEPVGQTAKRAGTASLERLKTEGRYIANTPVGKYMTDKTQSTAQGGLRPTLRQARAPLFGKVPDQPAKRSEQLDPNVRSAINKGRKELQKEAKKVFENEEKIFKTATQQEIEELEGEISSQGKLLKEIVDRLNELSGKIKQEEKSPERKNDGKNGGGMDLSGA